MRNTKKIDKRLLNRQKTVHGRVITLPWNTEKPVYDLKKKKQACQSRPVGLEKT
ncbi:MAG: hypothetical protein IJX67_01510 [Oscillospiraceae bacterium]|nr:hypothetical protein [Oscillospiraceae bacterium]